MFDTTYEHARVFTNFGCALVGLDHKLVDSKVT